MHKSLIILAFFVCYVSAYSQAYKRTHSTEIRLNSEIENSNNELIINSSTLTSSVTLTLPENDGDNDQVLTTDGNGVLSWTTKESSTSSNNLYFDAYDNTGGLTVGSLAVTIPFDVERENPDGTIFELSGGNVTINASDKFMIMYKVSIDVSSGTNRSDNITWLERNDGGGWIEVEGFRAHGYNRQSGEGFSTNNSMGIVDVASGDQFRVRAIRDSGTDVLETIADGSSITVFAIKNSGSGPAGPAGPEGPAGPPGTSSDFINIYNSSNGGVTIENTPATIPFNATSNSSGSIFNLNPDNTLEINASDDFMIQFIVTLEQVGGNNRTTWQTWLEVDAGGGYSEVDGSRGSGYSRQTSEGENTSMGQAIVTVSGSSTFRVRAQDTGSNRDHQAIPNGCLLVAYTLKGGEQGPAGSGGSSTLSDLIQGTGTSGQVAFFNGSSTLTSENELFYDSVNNYLGIGNSSPSYSLDVADQINVGNNGTSGSISIYSENGVTDYLVTLTSSSLTENTSYDFPSEQGDQNSVLQNDGNGNLTWASPTDRSIDRRFNVAFTGNNDVSLDANDDLLVCNNTGNSITLTLPTAVGLSGKMYKFKKTSATGAGNLVVITTTGSETIDGSSTFNLNSQYDAVSIISDNSEWYVISKVEN